MLPGVEKLDILPGIAQQVPADTAAVALVAGSEEAVVAVQLVTLVAATVT